VPTRDSLYGRRWKKASRAFLVEHPLCQCPACQEGSVRVRAATVVDHKTPHRGDIELFWDPLNWQALAKDCHDSYKQRLEKSGRVIGATEDGVPIDPRHHWHLGGGTPGGG
jgi:5-methylcytosine-specific restriction protein A